MEAFGPDSASRPPNPEGQRRRQRERQHHGAGGRRCRGTELPDLGRHLRSRRLHPPVHQEHLGPAHRHAELRERVQGVAERLHRHQSVLHRGHEPEPVRAGGLPSDHDGVVPAQRHRRRGWRRLGCQPGGAGARDRLRGGRGCDIGRRLHRQLPQRNHRDPDRLRGRGSHVHRMERCVQRRRHLHGGDDRGPIGDRRVRLAAWTRGSGGPLVLAPEHARRRPPPEPPAERQRAAVGP